MPVGLYPDPLEVDVRSLVFSLPEGELWLWLERKPHGWVCFDAQYYPTALSDKR
jgi:hypothetical protein